MGDRDNGGGYTANSVLSSFEVCVQGYSELQPIVVIKGGEQFGKTALGKMLMLSLCKKGIYPLILAARDVSSWRPRSIEGRLDEIIRSTYGAGSIDCYKQLDNAQKCLIIDDFEFGNLTKGYVDGIKALRQQFGKIIIFLHSQPGMEVAVTEFLLDESFVDSEVYDLQPMSYASRLDMIEKWLLIGRGGVEEVDHVKTSAAKFSKIVDETLGRNLIPPVPLFVIIILQRTELETDLDTVVRSGSHGFLYEALITQSLTKNVNLCTVDTALTYLTEFAGRLYQSGAVVLQQMKYEAFHSEHCAKYDLNIPVRDFQTQMEYAGILKYRDQVVEFKYPYHYYYFIARHLSGFDSWAKLEPHVDGLVSSVHTEKSANILLFLAHLGRNPKIGEKILLHADSILSTYSEADIYKQNALLSKYSFSDVKQILIEGPRSVQIEAHQEDARLSDEMTKELAEIAAEKLESRLHEALALNGAFKTLQVLGQVLRNHSGSTVKEEKRAFAGSCVSLGLRVMGLLIDMVDRHGREMIQFRALQLRAEDGRLTDDDIAQALEQYLPSMVAVNAVGTLIRIGTAIGSEELSPTLDSVLQGDKTRRLIRIITELEHFSKFPEREIKEFKENMIGSQDVLPYAIMRRFLIRRFYLFPSRDELRMSICDSFGIVRRPFIPLVQKKVGYSPNS
ncbi:hypothetical protein [Lysobacter sp. Root983]|uniref:STAND family AAA ATPase n=1 Tax=Lysobacter sp. Root983 TaxID=1736613 RepID=UPI000AB0F392|nr:hypothetical protein [Lysobacter sp. Root983]